MQCCAVLGKARAGGGASHLRLQSWWCSVVSVLRGRRAGIILASSNERLRMACHLRSAGSPRFQRPSRYPGSRRGEPLRRSTRGPGSTWTEPVPPGTAPRLVPEVTPFFSGKGVAANQATLLLHASALGAGGGTRTLGLAAFLLIMLVSCLCLAKAFHALMFVPASVRSCFVFGAIQCRSFGPS